MDIMSLWGYRGYHGCTEPSSVSATDALAQYSPLMPWTSPNASRSGILAPSSAPGSATACVQMGPGLPGDLVGFPMSYEGGRQSCSQADAQDLPSPSPYPPTYPTQHQPHRHARTAHPATTHPGQQELTTTPVPRASSRRARTRVNPLIRALLTE